MFFATIMSQERRFAQPGWDAADLRYINEFPHRTE